MDMATMVGLLAATPPSTRWNSRPPGFSPSVLIEEVRREVGRRRRRADADVGEVRVLEGLVHRLIRREDDRLQGLDVERRHHDVGHRVGDPHVVRQALDLVVQEGAVVLGPSHQAQQVRRRLQEPDPAAHSCFHYYHHQ